MQDIFSFPCLIFLNSYCAAVSCEYRMSILMMNPLRLSYHPLGSVMIKEGEFQIILRWSKKHYMIKTRKMHSSFSMIIPACLGL